MVLHRSGTQSSGWFCIDLAHNRVDGFASIASRFFLTESIVLTIESNVAQKDCIYFASTWDGEPGRIAI